MSKVIKRSFDKLIFDHIKKDLKFLVNRIHREHGELDMRLRDNYFNLYYQGNSMAKVRKTSNDYEILVHRKFTKESDSCRNQEKLVGYININKNGEGLRTCLSKTELDKMASRIKKVNWGEEVTFEQMLITDNPPSTDFIIIDRQITGGSLEKKRLDLLALRRITGQENEYKFVILEVKLGNNTELEGKVLDQLRKYIEIINGNIDEFSRCYENTYQQMKELELLNDDLPEKIKISGPVEGIIVVGGYSQIADIAINKMMRKLKDSPSKLDKNISIWQANNRLTHNVASVL